MQRLSRARSRKGLIRPSLRMETLENRLLLTVSHTFDAITGSLNIHDSAGSNSTIRVSTIAIQTSGGAEDRVRINESVTDVLPGDVAFLAVNAGDGNDNIDLSEVASNRFTSLAPAAGQSTAILVVGGAGKDLIRGSQLADTIDAGAGDDVVFGNDGNDLIFLSAGIDFARGDGGNDRISGGGGDDQLWGGPGDDVLSGSAGNDSVMGDQGDDILSGDAGDDTLLGMDGNDILGVEDGDPPVLSEYELSSPENLGRGGTANAGDDHLDGGAGTNLDYDDKGMNRRITVAPGVSGILRDDVSPEIEWVGSSFVDLTSAGAILDVVDGGYADFQVVALDRDGDTVSISAVASEGFPGLVSVDTQGRIRVSADTNVGMLIGTALSGNITVTASSFGVNSTKSVSRTIPVRVSNRQHEVPRIVGINSVVETTDGTEESNSHTSYSQICGAGDIGGNGLFEGISVATFAAGDVINASGHTPYFVPEGSRSFRGTLLHTSTSNPVRISVISSGELQSLHVDDSGLEPTISFTVPPGKSVNRVELEITTQPEAGAEDPQQEYLTSRYSFDVAVSTFEEGTSTDNSGVISAVSGGWLKVDGSDVVQDDVYVYRKINGNSILERISNCGAPSPDVIEMAKVNDLADHVFDYVSAAQNGTVWMNMGTGEFTYAPNPGFTGTDSFDYGYEEGDRGTVRIYVPTGIGVENVKELRPELDHADPECICGPNVDASDLSGDEGAKIPLSDDLSLVFRPRPAESLVELEIKKNELKADYGNSPAGDYHLGFHEIVGRFEGAGSTKHFRFDASGLQPNDKGIVRAIFYNGQNNNELSSGTYPYSLVLESRDGDYSLLSYSEQRTISLIAHDDYGFGRGWTLEGMDRLVVPPQDYLPGMPNAIANGDVFMLTDSGETRRFEAGGRLYGDPMASHLEWEAGPQRFTLTDKHGNQRVFGRDGYLKTKADVYGNTTTYDYFDTEVQPSGYSLGRQVEHIHKHISESGGSPTGWNETTTFTRNPATGQITDVTKSRPVQLGGSNYGTQNSGSVQIVRLGAADNNSIQVIRKDSVGIPIPGSTVTAYAGDRLSSVATPYSRFDVHRNDPLGGMGTTRIEHRLTDLSGTQVIIDSTTIVTPSRMSPHSVPSPKPEDIEISQGVFGKSYVAERKPRSQAGVDSSPKQLFSSGVNRRVGSRNDVGEGSSEFAFDSNSRRQSFDDSSGGFAYDYGAAGENGTVVSMTQSSRNSDGSVTLTVTTYDDDANVITVMHQDNSTEHFAYDSVQHFASGRSLTFVSEYIDRMGRRTETIRLPMSGGMEKIIESRIIGTVDPPGAPPVDDIRVVRDFLSDGRLNSETDPRGFRAEFEYDPVTENLISVKRAVGQPEESITEYSDHDVFGNPRHTRTLVEAPNIWRETDREFNSLGRIVQELSPDPLFGQKRPMKRYEYEGENLVREIRSYDGAIAGSEEEIVSFYHFDDLDRMDYRVEDFGGIDAVYSTSFGPRGEITGSTSPTGVQSYLYSDRNGRTIAQLGDDPDDAGPQQPSLIYNVFDHLGNVVAQIDPLGNVVWHQYDAENRETMTVWSSGYFVSMAYNADGTLSESIDAYGRLNTLEYDSVGRLWKDWRPDPNPNDNQPNQPTVYQYDSSSNLRFVTDPLGRTHETQYDALNRMKFRFDTAPDPNFPLIRPETEWDYSADGSIKSMTQLVGFDASSSRIERTWDYEYDGLGRTRSTILPLDPDNPGARSRTQTSYDAFSRAEVIGDLDGNYTFQEFDHLDRLVHVIGEHPTIPSLGVWPSDLSGRPESLFVYDGPSPLQLQSQKIADGSWAHTRFFYDGLDRPIFEVDANPANGQSPAVNWTPSPGNLHPFTAYQYDLASNIVSVSDAKGQTNNTVFKFVAGAYLPVVEIDPNGSPVEYGYDLAGRRISLTDPPTPTVPDGNTTSWVYDDLDRVIQESNSGNAYGAHRFFTFDLIGNLASKTDRDGRMTTYVFDQLNRVKEEVWHVAFESPGRTISYGYNLVHEMTSSSDPDHQSTYAYNAIGRVDSMLFNITNVPRSVLLDPKYDRSGDRKELRSSFLGTNPTADFRNEYAFDYLGRLTELKQLDQSVYGGTFAAVSPKRAVFAYDLRHQIDTIHRYASTSAGSAVAVSKYVFDFTGRIEGLDHIRGGNVLGNAYASRYTWDIDVGHQLKGFWSLKDGAVEYDYDPSGQLTGADYTNYGTFQRDELYQYDPAGNRTSVSYFENSVVDYIGMWSEPVNASQLQANPNVNDDSGAGKIGTRNGNTVWQGVPSVNPKEGDYAMLLDGAGDYVSVPNTGSTLSAGQGDFTFSAWVDFDDASQQQMTIMSHGNPTSIGGEGFLLEYLANSSSRPLRLYWNDGAGFSQNISWLSQTQLLGGWHHIAFTYKKSGAVTLYVDGLAYRAATNAQLNGIDPAASDPVYFGARMASGNPINGLKGYLDDVRIYGQALGQVGISNLFFDTNFNESSNYVTGANNRLISDGDNSYVYSYEGNRKVRYRLDGSGVDLYTWDHRNRLTSVNTYGPLESAKFGFDSDEGAYIPEDTGKGVPGELLGNTHYVEANNPQQIANYLALSFDGNGDTVMGGIQDAFTLTPKGMTMTLWFKPSGTQSNQTLVTYGSLTAGESGGYQLRYSYVPGSGSSTESLQFLLNDGIGSSQTVSYVLPASIQGQWHHVAVTVALTGQITMYVDGSAVTSATNTQTAAFGNVTTPLQLGMSGTTNAYTGLLDDVRFFALPIGSTHVAWTLQHGYAENVNIGKVEYAYNARNELITRKADADGTSGYQTELREHYIYDEGQIVLRLNSDGGVTHRYLWTNEVDQLLADEVVGGTTLWALSDHLGTVRDLVKYDASSSALDVVHRAFDSFGNVTQEVNPTNADILFGFTGRPFDPVADLQNNLNRWYDSKVGEWISEDPIGFAGGDANLFRYVQNSSVSYTDPNGLQARPRTKPGVTVSTGRGRMSVGMMSVFKDSGYFGSRMGATISGMFTPNPAKFLDKDGCPNCDRIGFVQVAQGTRRFHPNFDDPTMPVEPFVDGGIPYPHGTTSNPRSGNKIDFEDEPQGSVYGYFSFASHYSMRFETCVVCLKGREGITFNEAGFTPYMTDLTVQGITVYGCFSWGFAFNWNPTRKSYDYFQYVNDEQTRGMGSASSIYQPSATLSGPSQFWTNAVIGGSIY